MRRLTWRLQAKLRATSIANVNESPDVGNQGSLTDHILSELRELCNTAKVRNQYWIQEKGKDNELQDMTMKDKLVREHRFTITNVKKEMSSESKKALQH